jgi:diguanylate cyclase (GGDEF)-like protein/PAS domain S-box-containing protein
MLFELSSTSLFALTAAAGVGFGALGSWFAVRKRRQSTAAFVNKYRKLRDDHALMELIVRNANDGILIQDLAGHIEWSNPAYTRLTGFSPEEIKGRKPQEFVLPPHLKPTQKEIDDFRYDISSGVLEDFECIRNLRKDGTMFWNQLSFAVATFENGAEPKVIVIARDITEQVEREKELKLSEAKNRELAELDSLTKLPNRMKLTHYIEEQVTAARVANRSVGLLHIDLDQFKSINDTMGHAAGDRVLRHAASEMERIVGAQGMVGRFGGDEFLVVCPNVDSFEPLQNLAKKILSALERPFEWQDKVLRFGCSIGAAMTGTNTQTASDLIKHADVALYEVKKRGRHGVSCFNDALGLIYARRMQLSSELAEAIDNDELDIDLQPQYSLDAKAVHGFEALIRWHHPTLGKLGPHEFLETAEQNGLMARIDQIAAQKAFAALKKLHENGHEELRVSINVSTASLNSTGFVHRLCKQVSKAGLSPGHVTVEVLETNLLEGGNGTNLDVIRELANEGFMLELDDFGMGHAGLAHLARLATNGLKVDRSMVRNMLLDPATFTIVRAIIGLCQELSMTVVAEGVEEIEQAELLMEAGCNIIQGFGVGHPMPFDQAVQWLGKKDVSPIIENISPLNGHLDDLREFLAS